MTSVLIFEAEGIRFAIPSDSVRELVELPALSGWPAPPVGCLGVVDYRGRVLPVLDISLLLGGQRQHRTTAHQLLVIAHRDEWLAFLIEVAHDLKPLDLGTLDTANAQGLLTRAKHFLRGVTRLEGRVVLVPDLDIVVESLRGESLPTPEPLLSDQEEPRDILEARALALSQTVNFGEDDHREHLLVAYLGGERIGFEVKDVLELVPHPKITPVPGTGDHILGLCYHRGDLVRVVDIRAKRGLKSGPVKFENLVIVGLPGMLTGIAVESLDAVVAVETRQGQAAFQGGWISILDLEELEVGEPPSLDR